MRASGAVCRLGIWSRFDYVEPLTAGVGDIPGVANAASPGSTAGIPPAEFAASADRARGIRGWERSARTGER